MTLKRVFAILFSAMMLTQPVLTQAAITNVTDDSGGGGTVDATSDVNRENWSTTDENRKITRIVKTRTIRHLVQSITVMVQMILIKKPRNKQKQEQINPLLEKKWHLL